MKRYEPNQEPDGFENCGNCHAGQMDEKSDGPYVLYTDAVKAQREAFVAGYCAHAKYAGLWLPVKVPAEAEADSARRYKEE